MSMSLNMSGNQLIGGHRCEMSLRLCDFRRLQLNVHELSAGATPTAPTPPTFPNTFPFSTRLVAFRPGWKSITSAAAKSEMPCHLYPLNRFCIHQMPGHAPIVVEKLSDMFNNVYQMASPCAAGVSTTIKKEKDTFFSHLWFVVWFSPGARKVSPERESKSRAR